MMRASPLLIAFLLLAPLAATTLGADDAPKATLNTAPAFAIVIHGGAGSDPNTFSNEANAKRRASMEKALTVGRDILAKEGGASLDAVEAVIRHLEDDPLFNAGKGAVFNAAGNHELDASIMDGKDKSCGAVAGVTTVKNPISLARLVMTQTQHVLLAADGADEFAREQKVRLVHNDYFHTPGQLKEWKMNRQNENKKEQKEGKDTNAGAARSTQNLDRHYGTVGCVALDAAGNIAAGTSTGGLTNKKFGRVGDSPIVGAGTYADNATCGVSCTGVGEHFIRNAVAYDVSAQLKYKGATLKNAVHDVVHKTLEKGWGGLIAIDSRGNIVADWSTGGMPWAAADSSGRFDVHWGEDK